MVYNKGLFFKQQCSITPKQAVSYDFVVKDKKEKVVEKTFKLNVKK